MRTHGLLLTILCTGLLALASIAQAETRVELKNGRAIVGTIEKRTADVLWLQTTKGTLRIPSDQVNKIESVKPSKSVEKTGKATPRGNAEEGAKKPSREAVLHDVFSHLASRDKVIRAEGIATVLTGWPRTEFIVEAGLKHKDRRIRLAMIRILDMPNITDPRVHLIKAMRDRDVAVQVMAVRVLRHRKAEGVETHLVKAFDANRPWPVRQEILRTLEELGTTGCLSSVVASLRRCTDKRNAKAHRRVLKEVLDVDRGQDVEAWAKDVKRRVDAEAEAVARKGR
jgi:hypothetical protein